MSPPNSVTPSVPTSERAAHADRRPSISVVVPTYQRVDRLGRVLAGLARQTVDPSTFEVIVVSDGSTDGTDEYLARDDLPVPVVALRQPNRGPGAARNRGSDAARSDLVLFLDDDVVPAPDLLAEHLAAHDRRPDRVVIGPMLSPDDHEMSPWVAWEQRMLTKQYDAMNGGEYAATARQFYTGNASLPRRHLRDVGGFDETLRRAEDVELAYRLDEMGVGFHYQDSARGFHYAERSLASWDAIAYSYGRNDVAFARRPGREWLAEFMVVSFRRHHLAVRWCTRASIGRPRVRRAILGALHAVVERAGRRLVRPFVRPALSIVYSIRFHEGVSDGLGGPRAFRRFLRTRRIEPEPVRSSVAADPPTADRHRVG